MITTEDLGTIDYQKAWDYQKKLFQKALQQKKEQKTPENKLLLCEHPPVYTLGKSGKESNLLFSKELLGAEVFRIERGGDITFHGLGQLVAYPIFDIEQYHLGVKDFIYKVEQSIIDCIAHYGLKGERDSKNAGVWLDVGTAQQRKICALGFKLSRYVSMHGLALNVHTDLQWFQKMIPCGLVGLGVTSLAKELGEKPNFDEVKQHLTNAFQKNFEQAKNQ